MYPRKRQFERDFPTLKAKIREHFSAGVRPASSALQVATGIIEGFLLQLSEEEKQRVAEALATSNLHDIEALAERRIGGERDQKGDNAFFATRLCGVALLMAGRMAGVGAIRHAEYEHLVASIEGELGADEGRIAAAFAASAAPGQAPK